jgi:hypothetical protein
MRAILEVRNAAEYEALEPSKAEGEAVRNAWAAVLDWTALQQLKTSGHSSRDAA